MKRSSTTKNVPQRGRNARPGQYQQVFNGSKQRVRGLWKRNGRFYAQLAVSDPTTGKKIVRRIGLGDDDNPVTTIPQAIAAQNKLRTERNESRLKLTKRGKRLFEFVDEYLEATKARMRPASFANERYNLESWKSHLGNVALKNITPAMVLDYVDTELAEGRSGRTVNLKVISLRNLLKRAETVGLIVDLPFKGVTPCKYSAVERDYVPPEDIQHLADCAVRASQRRGQALADYLRLLLYSGCRMREAMRLRWVDVRFEQRALVVGALGDAKSGKSRTVDFNTQLEALLIDMKSRRQPDSQYLFPSGQRAEIDRHARSFRGALEKAKRLAVEGAPSLSGFGFHDARHTFASVCVMKGVDFMTVSKWLGHQDGGMLVAKTYGHLADEHRKQMAGKLNFGEAV